MFYNETPSPSLVILKSCNDYHGQCHWTLKRHWVGGESSGSNVKPQKVLKFRSKKKTVINKIGIQNSYNELWDKSVPSVIRDPFHFSTITVCRLYPSYLPWAVKVGLRKKIFKLYKI